MVFSDLIVPISDLEHYHFFLSENQMELVVLYISNSIEQSWICFYDFEHNSKKKNYYANSKNIIIQFINAVPIDKKVIIENVVYIPFNYDKLVCAIDFIQRTICIK